jgi:transcription elongation factor GreA
MSEADIKEGGNVQYLTPEGFQSLTAELEHLTVVKRPEIADRIRESQQHGEFSEDNSELDEVKFEQAMVEARIAELKALFSNAQQLDPEQVPTDYVGLASIVAVKDLEFGDEFDVQVVVGIEADPNQDRISMDSPMGMALLGCSAGETVEFESPGGRKTYKILSIRK